MQLPPLARYDCALNNTKDTAMQYLVYKDRAGFWRWQLQAVNGKVIADSGEGYVNRADCLHGLQLVKGSGMAPVVDGSQG